MSWCDAMQCDISQVAIRKKKKKKWHLAFTFCLLRVEKSCFYRFCPLKSESIEYPSNTTKVCERNLLLLILIFHLVLQLILYFEQQTESSLQSQPVSRLLTIFENGSVRCNFIKKILNKLKYDWPMLRLFSAIFNILFLHFT